MLELRQRANALDAALRHEHAPVRAELWEVLQELKLTIDGLVFRYVPYGEFVMGSDRGGDRERPPHPVELRGFYLAEAPVSWADFCRVLDWEPPPLGVPKEEPTGPQQDPGLDRDNNLRRRFCQDRPGGLDASRRDELERMPPFADPDGPTPWSARPMVAVSRSMALRFCSALSPPRGAAELPTEAQWERAARGFRTGARYPWGEAPATKDRCDCDHPDDPRIRASRHFPHNDYGLYAMSGGVWEWCADDFDPDFYARSIRRDPCCTLGRPNTPGVLRGGSWANAPRTATVSFRRGRLPEDASNPTLGFRPVWMP